MTSQIEIRIITYKRPDLLRRALCSLQSQTHGSWRAIVFDDSPAFESKDIVSEFRDERINSRLNPRNLGMILNLSQAFAARPYFSDSTHACILEDDNTFEPCWLEANLEVMQRVPHAVMVRNYHVVDVQEDGTFTPNSSQPMKELYGDAARELTLEERVREAFFNFTLGTSCFFWDLRKGVDLSFHDERLNGPVMEAGRALCFSEPCWYETEPLSTFSRFVCKAQTPRSETPATTHLRRMAKVSEIQFTRKLIRLWRNDFNRNLAEILNEAEQRKEGIEALQRLAEAGCLSALFRLRTLTRWIKAIKSILIFHKYKDAWSKANAVKVVID